MTNNKPLQFKEFWIYKISPGVTRVSDSKVTLDDEYFGPPDYDVPIFPTKVIHVVEYSAYDKAQQEIAELKAKLLEFEGMTFSENEEIKTLKDRCARFEGVLKMLVATISESGFFSVNLAKAIILQARQALEVKSETT